MVAPHPQPRQHLDPVPACHLDAGQRLVDAEIAFSEVIRVDPDAILYLDGDELPMIAWMRDEDGRDEIVTETGFPADPGPHVPQPTGKGWTTAAA